MPGPTASDASRHPLTVRGDARGKLVAIEGGTDVPFDIARVYYLYGTSEGAERGFHAHQRLRQFAVAVSGSCTMMLDDGTARRDVRLDDPGTGVLIEPMMWHEMRDFSADCVLLVLADAAYDEGDYIRDYDQFLAAVADAR